MPGYQVTTLEPVKGGIVCPHCKLPLRDAVQTIEEGHRLCESCYKEICSKPRRTCDDCGISLGPDEQFYPDRAVRRDILQLNVRCNYHTNGCMWIGQLQNLQEHCQQCRYQPVSCPNEGCEQLLVPDELDRHIDEECSFRRVKCEHCGQEELANRLEEHHGICPKYPVECHRCKICVSRDKMEDHRLYYCTHVSCEGCGKELLRTQASPPPDEESTHEHLADPNQIFSHMQSLSIAVRANRSLIKRLESGIAGQREHPGRSDVERAVKTLENRVTALQRMMETQRDRQIEELRLQVNKQDAKMEQVDQRTRNLEVKLKQSPQAVHGGDWASGAKYPESVTHSSYGSGVSNERIVTVEKKLEELERQSALLKVHVSELELQLQASLASTHNGCFLWRIPDVSRRRRDAIDERITSIYSPPFYTGRNGYKMCVRAYLNGDGVGYRTHLSMFFVLMKGEYDPLLKWPFEHKVSLILVDQNHRKHIVQTFKPTPESSSFRRPRSDMNVASGCPQFAKLTTLDDENYVKEDILYIKCIVDTSKIFHP